MESLDMDSIARSSIARGISSSHCPVLKWSAYAERATYCSAIWHDVDHSSNAVLNLQASRTQLRQPPLLSSSFSNNLSVKLLRHLAKRLAVLKRAKYPKP
jgi:hypothetical protein